MPEHVVGAENGRRFCARRALLPAVRGAGSGADVKARLLEIKTHSVGTFGSPTFFPGDEIFFGKDSLLDVVRRLCESGPRENRPWLTAPCIPLSAGNGEKGRQPFECWAYSVSSYSRLRA